MRVSTKFVTAVAALLFGFLLVPRAALAQSTANCPVEPVTNVPIANGEVFAGTNCVLYNPGNVDSFTFTGTSGDTYQLATALASPITTNICLTLYNPSFAVVYGPTCTNAFAFGGGGPTSVVTDQKLTATGTYTIDITQPQGSSGTQQYALSLYQLYPFPSYATPDPEQEDVLNGNVAELTDANFFTFAPSDTTGEYEVTATLTSSPTQNICMTVYNPDGTIPQNGSGCTNAFAFGGGGPTSVVVDFTPDEDGTSMAFVSVDGNDGTQTYTLEVSCKVGDCPPFTTPPPPCTLKDALSYNATSSTLTMNFTVGTNVKATWNAWLTYQPNVMTPLFSGSQAITNPPVPITKTYTGLPPEGTVGVLSTLTVPSKGISCSSWQQISTGTGP